MLYRLHGDRGRPRLPPQLAASTLGSHDARYTSLRGSDHPTNERCKVEIVAYSMRELRERGQQGVQG